MDMSGFHVSHTLIVSVVQPEVTRDFAEVICLREAITRDADIEGLCDKHDTSWYIIDKCIQNMMYFNVNNRTENSPELISCIMYTLDQISCILVKQQTIATSN